MDILEEGSVSADDLKMLDKVAKQLGLTVTQAVVPVPGKVKVVKGIITCALCRTVTIQFMQLSLFSNGVWRKTEDLIFDTKEPPSIGRDNLYKCTVKACWACREVLMLKSKEELIAMLIKLYAPIPSKEEVWKYIRELKTQPVSFNVKRARKGQEEDE